MALNNSRGKLFGEIGRTLLGMNGLEKSWGNYLEKSGERY